MMAAVDLRDEAGAKPPHEILPKDPVVIAIVGYRNAGDIRTCLSALAGLTEKNFIVSICENGGREAYATLTNALDGLLAMDGVPPPVIDERVDDARAGRLQPGGQPVRLYLSAINAGYAGGINISIRQLARTEEWSGLWILNPDAQPHPDALAALIARSRDGYSIVSSRLVFAATERVQSYGGQWRILMARGLNIGMNAPRDAVPDADAIARTMDYASGASMFVTRDYINAVGLLDERYFLYCEEVDWCLRRGSRRLGYAHEAIVFHAHGTTIGSSADRRARSKLSVYLDERNKLLLTRRFFPVRYPLVVVATLLLTTQYLKAGAVRNFFVALSGWWAGVRGEVGFPARLPS